MKQFNQKSTLDSQYLEKLQLGDELGLRYFMSQYAEQLFVFANRITKNREAAEEIVSESFCKLWFNRANASSLQAIKSFLFLITRNACYDHVGSAFRKTVDLGDELLWDKIENRTDVLTDIIYSELIEQIILELDKLPKYQAEVFRMTYLEGMDTNEICSTLGTTANNIYFARSKAMAALKLVFKKKDISLYGIIALLSMFWG
ncbi:RNA polymerase sigma factor [Sphingobacterium hotanense]|uniref:RNA polymerase sigma factor n=1 Tax=Sphingobacterium hotanense TaxID=649196 RepID=UPI0021A3AB39|nr:RNA polymerase sigma factor [Sphingobacterium hotanense]MCT1524890.1 RNA polymerase sigma factor [Sphingobacterium hotanense]